MTENKYQLEVEKPELLDDWDQRFVISTLSRDLQANRLTLVQTAEKDQATLSQSNPTVNIVPFFSVSVKTALSSLKLTRRTPTF